MAELSEVYGMNNNRILLSYVEREIDRRFTKALADDGKSVVVVYGASKQGSFERHFKPSSFGFRSNP